MRENEINEYKRVIIIMLEWRLVGMSCGENTGKYAYMHADLYRENTDSQIDIHTNIFRQ